MIGQIPARCWSAITSPAAEHHCPLAGTKLYCLVTEAHRCEQLAQSCYAALPRVGFEPATYRSQVQRYTRCTTAPPANHICLRSSRHHATCDDFLIYSTWPSLSLTETKPCRYQLSQKLTRPIIFKLNGLPFIYLRRLIFGRPLQLKPWLHVQSIACINCTCNHV